MIGEIIVYMSEQGKLRAMEQQIQDQQRLAWAMLIVGVAAGLLGMHFLVARPMNAEIASLRQNLKTVNSQVEVLIQESVDSGYTTSLLSELRSQREHLTEAKVALRQWENLNKAMLVESNQTAQLAQSLTQLQKLTKDLVAISPAAEQAQVAYDRLDQMQSELIELGKTTASAQQALEQSQSLQRTAIAQKPLIASAREILAQQENLYQSLTGQTEMLHVARGTVGQFAQLNKSLIDAASQLDVAQRVSDVLVQIEQTLHDRPVSAEATLEEAQQLVAVSKKLHEMQQLPLAEANVDRAARLVGDLAGRTGSLADAAENLELIVDFQQELGSQIRSLTSLREQFFQLSLLEKSIGNTVQILQPLFELTNLKRLDGEELRTAARSILEQRSRQDRTQLVDQSRQAIHGVTISTGTENKIDGQKNDSVPQPLD